jgi:hypothetical protein
MNQFLRFAAVGLVIAMTGCSKSSSAPAAPSGPVRTVLTDRSFNPLSIGAQRVDVTAPGTGTATGTLEATLNWSQASNTVYLYFSDGTCVGLSTVGICAGRPCCTIMASATTTAKPKTLSLAVAPGSYTVWVANMGPGADTGTLTVAYTR